MAYQVLARKWRPKTFADLVGQEHVVKALRNALDEGRLHHAYLLTGTRGVGKTTIARILAKSLNCQNADHGEPCGVCDSCTQIDSGRYVDLLEIDAASNTGIDNIREVLENAQYAPTAGKYKVYIIDEVHMLSKSAFNAMLKTLEEPPEHVKFILATTDPHKVPITVLSRCLQFVLRNMTTQQVADHLAHVLNSENIAYEAPALQLLGRAASGSMRDALSLLDQAIAMGSGQVTEQDVRQMIGAVDKRYLYELLQGIAAQNGEALLAKAQEMAARAIGFDSALNELAVLLQRLALIQAVPSALGSDDPERDTLLALSQSLSGEQIQLYYQCVIHGKQDLSLAPDEYAGFAMTLLRLLAFAPLAASDYGTSDTIENTQLNQQPADALPPKKPVAAEHNVQTAADMPSENVPPQRQRDTPPWEDLPSDNAAAAPSQPRAIPAKTMPSETFTRISDNQHAHMPQLPATKHNNDRSAAVSDHIHSMPSENRADNSSAEQAFDNEIHDANDNPSDAVAMPNLPITSNNDDEDEDDGAPVFAPLPDFQPQNWPALVQRFAQKLGAAQMLAQHAAWTQYDADTHLMVLALTNEARATTNKERLDKIRDTLADAYGLPLKLQTETWRDDAGWETPVMRSRRLQIEGRQQAQALLEADSTAQQILQAFDAQWRPETLELKQPQT